MLKKCGEAKKVIKKFRKITWELSRLAIAGDGDRNCIFRPNLVPCNMLKFSKNDPKVFVRQIRGVSEEMFRKCGKQGRIQKMTIKHMNKVVQGVEKICRN